MKNIKKALWILFSVLLALGIAAWLYLQSKRPVLSGNIQLKGLTAEVTIFYDEYGIPHIYAQNEEDLFYAFGYVHAQDRLFQMEMVRRLADGRLSEVFGKNAVDLDKFFRSLSLRHYAKRTIDSVYTPNANQPFVKAANAYLKGVNEYVANGTTPLEFEIAGIPKTPFIAEDIEVIAGYMGYTFEEAFKAEATGTWIKANLGDNYFKDIADGNWHTDQAMIPVQAQERKQTLAGAKTLLSLAERIQGFAKKLPHPPYLGSNGWVISGKKTKSGKPILSNDTHIGFAQPSVWYEAHLECPNFKFYGSFIAGTPFGALGHSQYGGWGITMFENDDADFYQEKYNSANNHQVWFKDHWEDLKIRHEIIKVKGEHDVALAVKESRHGILINEVQENYKNSAEPIALWWTYYHFPNRSLQAFYELAHAHNAQEAGLAAAKMHAPGLNIMWGDTTGNIAWWAAAKLVKRPSHVNPALILNGSTGKDEPLGWFDFSENPQILNPTRGVLYTANNQPADMGKGLISGYYVPSDRATRIEQLLFSDKNDWTAEEVRKVINDNKNPNAAKNVQHIATIIAADITKQSVNVKTAFELFRKWDGSHELANVEPTIYYRFLYRLCELTFKDELGLMAFNEFKSSHSFKRNLGVFLQNDASPWWDNTKTPAKESRKEQCLLALVLAVSDLEKQLEGLPDTWKWERVHFLYHKHPLDIIPIIGKKFNVGPFAATGGRETINNLDFDIDSTGLYRSKYGPALRRIVDFGKPNNATGCLPTGQSGNVMSPHYADQAELYAAGKARPEYLDRLVIEKMHKNKLIFKP